MKKIAIVVPRCHETLTGGAEAHGWQYATMLTDRYEVELLTTTAKDYVTWANDLPEGIERRDKVSIRRFHVDRGRSEYFHDLHRRLLAHVAERADREPQQRVQWTEALQEEFVRAQGPVCEGLYRHLRQHGDEYAAVIFLTYLYPTTLDGTRALRHRRWGIVPTLHDEAAAYFCVIAHLGRSAPKLLWNTPAERRLGQRLWQTDERDGLVAMTVVTEPAPPAREAAPYLLYCGRIDHHKGCGFLLDAFAAYKRAHPGPLQLVLTGADQLGVRNGPDVRYLGFVDEARKFSLMAGALAFVQPSPNESLSIVTLEAMAQGTPVIVNADCEPLVDHVHTSRSGHAYRGEAEFHAAIDAVQALSPGERQRQGALARAYVVEHYSAASIRQRLHEVIEELAASDASAS